jgi:probable F420-dependent oxidoreductase
MRFGVHLPQIGRGGDRQNLLRFARLADELGFDSGWVSDHIAWPAGIESKYPYTENGDFPVDKSMPWLDPIGTLLFTAACTEHLKLGTTVLILGYRPPVQTAKLLATLDVLSEGRLILGVGVGWMKEEFEVLGMPFDHRGGRGDEQLEIFERLFTEPEPSFDGRFYSFPPVGFFPKPPAGRVPIWVGGNTPVAFERTARYGDCFHAAFTPIAELREHWAAVKEACERRGRHPLSLEFSVRVYLDFDETMDPEKSVSGPPDRMLERINEFAELGASHILFDIVAPGGVAGRMQAMQRFAGDVMPKAV